MGNDELQPRTFYVNLKDLEAFKRISPISTSEAIRNLFRSAIEESFDDAQLVLRAELMEDTNRKLNERLNELNTEKDSILEQIRDNQRQAKELRERALLIKRTNRLGELTTTLNKQLVAFHFDEEYIADMCADIIYEIKLVKPTFDLTKHIARMKVIMGFA